MKQNSKAALPPVLSSSSGTSTYLCILRITSSPLPTKQRRPIRTGRSTPLVESAQQLIPVQFLYCFGSFFTCRLYWPSWSIGRRYMGQAVGSILSRFYCSGTSPALLTINASRALLTVIPFRSSSSLTEGGYDQLTRDLTGEDTHSYKLRHFFFACSRVQTLYANWQSLTPAISAFFMQHLPFGSEHLFPALKMIYWIEKDRNEPKISLRSSPIELPAFQTF